MARKTNRILSGALAGAMALGAMGCESDPRLFSVAEPGDTQEEELPSIRYDGPTVTSNFLERIVRNQSPDEYHVFEGRTPTAPATAQDIAQMNTLTSRIYGEMDPSKTVEGPSGFNAFMWRQSGEESDLYLICSAGAEAQGGLALQMDSVCNVVFTDAGVEVLENIPSRAEPNSYDVTNPFLEEGPNAHPHEVVAPVSNTGIRLILPHAPSYTADPEHPELGPENLQGIMPYSPLHDEPRMLHTFPQNLTNTRECVAQGGTPYAAYNGGQFEVGETETQAVSTFGSFGDTAADVCVVSYDLEDREAQLGDIGAYRDGIEATYRLVFAAQRSLEEKGLSSRHPNVN